jgi:hypothetical protein
MNEWMSHKPPPRASCPRSSRCWDRDDRACTPRRGRRRQSDTKKSREWGWVCWTLRHEVKRVQRTLSSCNSVSSDSIKAGSGDEYVGPCSTRLQECNGHWLHVQLCVVWFNQKPETQRKYGDNSTQSARLPSSTARVHRASGTLTSCAQLYLVWFNQNPETHINKQWKFTRIFKREFPGFWTESGERHIDTAKDTTRLP